MWRKKIRFINPSLLGILSIIVSIIISAIASDGIIFISRLAIGIVAISGFSFFISDILLLEDRIHTNFMIFALRVLKKTLNLFVISVIFLVMMITIQIYVYSDIVSIIIVPLGLIVTICIIIFAALAPLRRIAKFD